MKVELLDDDTVFVEGDNLDEKLINFLEYWRVAPLSIDEAPAALRQVFNDSGWELINPYRPTKHVPVMLSGQEWYDRFSTALVGYACLPVDAGSVDWDAGDVMRAAKKAAGIE